MSRTTMRWTMAGALALAALGAIGGFTPGVATAEAAPSVSPFAGSWSGTFSVADSVDPEFGLVGTFEWTISDAGRITGAFSEPRFGPGTFVGHVRDDGKLMVIMIKEGGGVPHEGTAAIDGDGNLFASAADAWPAGTHTWSLVATHESD